MNNIYRYNIDTDGIAVLTWDEKTAPVNVLSSTAVTALTHVVDEINTNDSIKGVVLASAKSDFVVGANLHEILAMPQASDSILTFVESLHRVMRAMETGGKPYVAALNGTALGGGLEIALACHHRVAAVNVNAKFGFPEVNLGLLPGGGGTQRWARMVGIEKALPWLTQGGQVGAEAALQAGLIDELVDGGKLIVSAKAWIKQHPDALQPWDVNLRDRHAAFRLPGGEVQSKQLTQIFMGAEAMLRKKTQGNYLAPQAIMEVLYEGCQLPIDQALTIEARAFVKLLLSSQSKAMIRTFFFALQDANKLKTRPAEVTKKVFKSIGILGAGMMGAGIAYSSAMSGMNVVLLDAEQDLADRGKSYSEGVLQKRLASGRITQEKMDVVLQRITATDDYNELTECELIIEAVFEDRNIKAEVTEKAEAVINPEAIFASNTSTLPITGLAQASRRPQQFIGLHFFSPVDKMQLVEVILGDDTSQETLAKSLDYIQQIRKTPITVNDSRGFYTSRVFKTYVLEGMAMLEEGVAPALIENAGKLAGMPVGPLALADEVTIELMDRIMTQTRKDLGDGIYESHPAEDVADFMVRKAQRIGKRSSKGFYDYDGRHKKIWSGLAEQYPVSDKQPNVEYVKNRLLVVQGVETLHCFQENVITNAMEADLGSVLGWGFAPFTGGVISYIETITGMEAFQGLANELADSVGERYRPPQLLADKIASKESFYSA